MKNSEGNICKNLFKNHWEAVIFSMLYRHRLCSFGSTKTSYTCEVLLPIKADDE